MNGPTLTLVAALPWRPVIAVACLIVVAILIARMIFQDVRRWSNGDF